MDVGKPSAFASPPLDFKATAYCSPGITRSGAPAGPGIVAADPAILPMGTLIWIDACAYSGVYQVMDTGRLVRGRIIDVFVPDEAEALEFGRQKVKLIVLRYGHLKRQGIQESKKAKKAGSGYFSDCSDSYNYFTLKYSRICAAALGPT